MSPYLPNFREFCFNPVVFIHGCGYGFLNHIVQLEEGKSCGW